MSDFENFKEQLPSKEKFYISLTGKKIVTKSMNMFLRFGKKIEIKTMKIHHDLYLKCDILLLAVAF